MRSRYPEQECPERILLFGTSAFLLRIPGILPGKGCVKFEKPANRFTLYKPVSHLLEKWKTGRDSLEIFVVFFSGR